MSGKPWLSIVVPAYNAEDYLAECISSFNLDVHPDVEALIVDDGSTDRTSRICDELDSLHDNLIVVHRENGGSSAARNTGCARAAGDWIWFVDSDDIIAPYALDVIKRVTQETDCDAVQIQFLKFSDGDRPRWRDSVATIDFTTLTSSEYLREIYRGRGQHYVWSFVMRTVALLDRNEHSSPLSLGSESGNWPFREDFSMYEDVVSMEEILRRFSGVSVLQSQCYGYRQTASSMTQKPSNKSADSGLRAVRDLSKYDAVGESRGKLLLEISLLFNSYKLVEWSNASSDALRLSYKHEIESRVRQVGLAHLGFNRIGRFILLKAGLFDFVLKRRCCQ